MLATAIGDHDRRTRGHGERVRLYTELHRRRTPHPARRARQAPVGGAHPRRGQDRGPDQDPQQEGPSRRRRVVDPPTSPLAGERLVMPVESWLGDAVHAVGGHHERWDGTGYPRGLEGEDIPRGRDRGSRRRLRGDDRCALVQGGNAARRGACRAHSLRRQPLQPGGGASPAERLDRSSSAFDGGPRGTGPPAIPRSGDQGRGLRTRHRVRRGRVHDVHCDSRRRTARRHGSSRRRPAPRRWRCRPAARATFDVPAYLQAVPVPPTESSLPVAPVAVPEIEVAAAPALEPAPPIAEVPTMAPTNSETAITTTTPATTTPATTTPPDTTVSADELPMPANVSDEPPPPGTSAPLPDTTAPPATAPRTVSDDDDDEDSGQQRPRQRQQRQQQRSRRRQQR